jgi:hypothetical protein
MIGGSRKRRAGLKRNPIDKYYTNNKVAKLCYQHVKKHLKIKKSDMVIEPAAGKGVFIPFIKKLSHNWRFFDIKPEHLEIEKQNFLKYKGDSSRSLHIFGNPPFGRKSSTAIKFIKHCAALNASSISFILPRSFKKASFQKSFALQYHLLYQKELPEYSFIYNDKPYDVPCIFQIWEKRDYPRKKPVKEMPNGWYQFVKRPDCTLAIRRVGFSVGHVRKCSQDDNENTNWFIKIMNGYITRHRMNGNNASMLKKLNKIRFKKDTNTGAYSISKQDIIKKYNKI